MLETPTNNPKFTFALSKPPYTGLDLPMLRTEVKKRRKILDLAWKWLEDNPEHKDFSEANARFERHLNTYEYLCRSIRRLERQENRKIGNV